MSLLTSKSSTFSAPRIRTSSEWFCKVAVFVFGTLSSSKLLVFLLIVVSFVNADGMVVDFTRIKEVVMEKLDHQNLNEVLPFNPTAENIARWVCKQIPQCYKVEVQESEGNIVIYEKDTVKDNASNDVKDHSEDKEE